MADPVAGVGDDDLTTPIANQTAEELEATLLRIIAERNRLAEQQAELDRLSEDWLRVKDMRDRGCQVHRALVMREKDGVLLFLTPSYNLVDATAVAQAIKIPEGTPGHDDL